jgi:hypothetical protein
LLVDLQHAAIEIGEDLYCLIGRAGVDRDNLQFEIGILRGNPLEERRQMVSPILDRQDRRNRRGSALRTPAPAQQTRRPSAPGVPLLSDDTGSKLSRRVGDPGARYSTT